MQYYCTYFDSNYLPQGLALYQSLVRWSPPFLLWVLCLDDETYTFLTTVALQHVMPISLQQFEAHETRLVKAKQNRNRIEYYFTCTPFLPHFILKTFAEVPLITYLDADLYFFSDPTPIHEEMSGNSILITEHRFPDRLSFMEEWGLYNVQFLSFKKDEEGLACLEGWGEQCIEWCYDRLENGRYADQKYLDEWPKKFKHVRILQHRGAGVAPWNLDPNELQLENNIVMIAGFPLVFFHFHHLRIWSKFVIELGLTNYNLDIDNHILEHIYLPYIRQLFDQIEWASHSGFRKSRNRSTRNEGQWRFLRTLLHRDFLLTTKRFTIR